MAPPSFVDLGKQARDLFSRGYHFGLWKMDCKTKTSSGIEFITAGSSNQESGKVLGSLETKFKVNDYGMMFTERYNTENKFFTEVAVQDQLAEGLRMAIQGTFHPPSGEKSGLFKVGYGVDNVKLDADMNIDLEGPLINASAVLGYEGWLAGYSTGFDTKNSSLTTNTFALGYTTPDFILHAAVQDGQDLSGSIFQRCSNTVDIGVQLAYPSGDEMTFGIAAKYQLDSDALVRAKINNAGQIGLGYQQKVRDGITLLIAALVDGKNLGGGAHKAGVAIELEV